MESQNERVKQVFKEYANIELSEEVVGQFNKNTKSARSQVYHSQRMGWMIGSMIAEQTEVGVINRHIRDHSTTGGHTGNLVPIFTYGSGAERFEGVHIPKIIADLMGYL